MGNEIGSCCPRRVGAPGATEGAGAQRSDGKATSGAGGEDSRSQLSAERRVSRLTDRMTAKQDKPITSGSKV